MSTQSPLDASSEPRIVVNRVVFPTADQSETAPLYATPWRPKISSQSFAQGAKRPQSADATPTAPFIEPSSVYQFTGRRSLHIESRRRVSLATYFNAFPASYWQRWTGVRTVHLSVTVSGTAKLIVLRSSARGRYGVVEALLLNDETKVLELPLDKFFDGGFYWFDLLAGENGVTLEHAEWLVDAPEDFRAHRLSIAVTTFNRPSYCLDQINAIAGSPDTLAVLDKLYVVDQGTDLVQDQAAFSSAAAKLGDTLQIIRQANLGGSGGFSRGMYETVKAGQSDHVLLLDDDAISEPEAIVRAVNFSQFCLRPTLVGGGMLHLDDRPVLYAQGERYDHHAAWMLPASPDGYDHDFAAHPLRDSPLLHRRNDVDFNGWWMTLIPTAVIREIGLSLPAFIKWDDLEYGIRAQEHGYQTVSLPGVAVWHMAWHDKDPVRTWEEYFTHRNRIIGTLMHSRSRKGGKLPSRSLLGDLKLLLTLEYSAVHLRQLAISDVFRGPDVLSQTIATRLGEIRTERSHFSDAQVISDASRIPNVRQVNPAIKDPGNVVKRGLLAVRVGARHFFTKTNTQRLSIPEKSVQAQDIFWWRFAEVDSALVTTPGGDGVAWFKRDRDTLRRQLRATISLITHLRKNWEPLSKEYTEALPRVTSMGEWARIFGLEEDRPEADQH